MLHSERRSDFFSTAHWLKHANGNRDSRLPVWASGLVILSLSGLCYWLLFLLIRWLFAG